MMKTKDNKILYSVITAIVIVVVFALVFGLYFSRSKNDIYITLYSPINNEKQVIKTSSGSDIDSKLEPMDIDGYEFIGWFYDDDLTVRVEKGTIFNSSRVLKAGYSKVIVKNINDDIDYNDISNEKYLTIKTYGGTSLTNNEIKTILNKGVKYLNLEGSDFEKTYIDNETFFAESNIRGIVLPRNITLIENSSFKNCYNLSYVKLNNNISSIENNAFYNCKSLVKIDNFNKVEYLGDSVFEGCDNLKELNLGKSIKELKNKTFYGVNLNNITIENENPYYKITGNVLYTSDYSKLIYVPTNYSGNLVINESTTVINDYSMFGVKYLTSVTIPSSINYIGESSFKNCKMLESVTFNSATHYSIQNNAFEGCENLKQLNFSAGLESIGREAFKNCKSLKKIIFNISTASNISSISSIGNSAFKNCKSLESIVLPDCVMYIGNELFSGCSSLEYVKISAGINYITEKMFYENSSLEKVVANSEITSIGNYAFAECSSLTDIEDLYTSESLGYGAFRNCRSLTTAIFDNANAVSDECFYNCFSLKDVSFNKATSLGKQAFMNCESFTSFIIENNVNKIENNTFENCKNIVSFTASSNQSFLTQDGVLYDSSKQYIIAYPQNKKDIHFTILSSVIEIKDKGLYLNQYLSNIDVAGGNSYYSSDDGILFDYNKTTLLRYPCGKTNLNVSISYNVSVIEEYAFAFNKNMVKLTLPSSVTTIKENALYDVPLIKELIIPFIGSSVHSNKYIGYLFGANSYVANNNFVPESLKKVTITNDTHVGEYEFYDATYIEYIEFNKEVSNVNKYAFYGASKLTEIYFKGSLSSVKTNSFYKLSNLKTLTFGFDSNLLVENSSIGELKYSLDIYIHNKNQNVPQSSRSILMSKFSNVYTSSKNWKWHF